MRRSFKFLGWMCLAAWSLAMAGCSGINSSHSFSPASFILPGILQNDCPDATPVLIPEPVKEIASAR